LINSYDYFIKQMPSLVNLKIGIKKPSPLFFLRENRTVPIFHNQIVADARLQVRKIGDFLGGAGIDHARMLAAVDEKLYRKRRPQQ
jgi:hypothetical protein